MDNRLSTSKAVRCIQHEASNAEKVDEQAAADARRGADARRRFWHEARALKGTPGESYLRRTRGIEARAWPSSILWNQNEHAIVCAVTSDARKVVAVQIIRVTRDGKKDDGRGPAKQSFGPVSRGVVRLPGRATGPLCFCEGVETGLSVWAATGYETWVLLGGLKRAADIGPRRRRVVLCRDDDKRTSPAAKVGKTAIRAMRAAGVDVVDAFPWGTRRADKSDFNDLARESGLGAVRQRIDLAVIDRPSIGQILVPVQEARRRIDRRVSRVFRRRIRMAARRDAARSRAGRNCRRRQDRSRAAALASLVRAIASRSGRACHRHRRARTSAIGGDRRAL